MLALAVSLVLVSCADFAGPALTVNGQDFSQADLNGHLEEYSDSLAVGTGQQDRPASVPIDGTALVTSFLVYDATIDDLIAQQGFDVNADKLEAQRQLLLQQGLDPETIPQLQLDTTLKFGVYLEEMLATGVDGAEAFGARLAESEIDIDPRYNLVWDEGDQRMIPAPAGT